MKTLASLQTLIACLLIAVIGLSCSSVTEPSDEITSQLGVQAYVLSNTGRAPASGARIVLTEITNANQEVPFGSPTLTDASGETDFTLIHPVVGRRFRVSGVYNNVQSDRSITINVCADTTVTLTFTNETPPSLTCQTLNNTTEQFIYRDDSGSDSIRRNSQVSERCKTLFTNTGTDPITVDRKTTTTDPISVNNFFMNGSPVTLPVTVAPGSSLSVCFGINTSQTGTFDRTLELDLNCTGKKASYKLQIHAVITERTCDCGTAPSFVVVSDENTTRVELGKSESFSEIIYTNTSSCDVELIPAGRRQNLPDWKDENLKQTVTLKPGESFTFNITFEPKQTGKRIDTLLYAVRLANGTVCPVLNVVVGGVGCRIGCPEIVVDDPKNPLLFNDGKQPVISLSNTKDGRVNFSSTCAGNLSKGNKSIALRMPSDVCEPVTLNITIDDTSALKDNGRWFSMTPRSLTLAAGDSTNLDLTFTAPSIPEFDLIYTARGRKDPQDSTFAVVITIQSPRCVKKITATATVTNLPRISPVRNIRAYRQVTIPKPSPEYEVYFFDGDSISARRRNDLTPFPGEGTQPQVGDFYIDVADPTTGTAPPKIPIMFLRNGGTFSYFARLRRGYPEASFDQVRPVLTDMQNDVIAAGGFNVFFNTGNPLWRNSSQNFNDPQPGDVYLFWDGSKDAAGLRFCKLAMIYIRQINDGTENNTNKQSALEFRALNGIR